MKIYILSNQGEILEGGGSFIKQELVEKALTCAKIYHPNALTIEYVMNKEETKIQTIATIQPGIREIDFFNINEMEIKKEQLKYFID